MQLPEDDGASAPATHSMNARDCGAASGGGGNEQEAARAADARVAACSEGPVGSGGGGGGGLAVWARGDAPRAEFALQQQAFDFWDSHGGFWGRELR